MSNQLNKVELPTGLQRENPFQSCLDLHEQSKTGNPNSYINFKYFYLLRKILD